MARPGTKDELEGVGHSPPEKAEKPDQSGGSSNQGEVVTAEGADEQDWVWEVKETAKSVMTQEAGLGGCQVLVLLESQKEERSCIRWETCWCWGS